MKPAEIERLLPWIFRRTASPGSPLAALLEVMAVLHAPVEDVLAGLDAYFDPRRTPADFLPYLARWVDLEALLAGETGAVGTADVPDFPPGDGRLRELVAAAAFLSRWRGTRKGLLRFLEVATGERGFDVVERVPGADGRPRPLHLLVRAPRPTEPYRDLLRRIVEYEKPAACTYDLEFFDSAPPAPPEPAVPGTPVAPPAPVSPGGAVRRDAGPPGEGAGGPESSRPPR
ncbi:MAG TPA: phage tail protein [Chloroflexota bacterium]|nr:phage tail protein [Chloroflexota bacterium]